MKTSMIWLISLWVSAAALGMQTETKDGCSGNAMRQKYRFQHFQPSKVFFRKGNPVDARLNYNYILGALEYIDDKGDTLTLTNKAMIRGARIGELDFHCTENADMEIILGEGDVSIAKVTEFVPRGSGKSESERMYRAEENAPAPTSLLISNRSGEFQWQNNRSETDYYLKVSYFLIDRNQNVHPAGKAGFMQVFGRHRPEVLAYLNEHRVRFNDENDLAKLLAFCTQF